MTLNSEPYVFDTPRTLDFGENTLALIAQDNQGAQQIETIVVSNDNANGCRSNNRSALVALMMSTGMLL